MLRAKLPEWVKAELLKRPESKLGYQVVAIILKDGRALENLFVANADTIELPDNAPWLVGGDGYLFMPNLDHIAVL